MPGKEVRSHAQSQIPYRFTARIVPPHHTPIPTPTPTPPEVIWPGADGEIPVAVLLEEQFANLRYVWLTRRNKARQALSYYRASVTGQWWDIPGVDPESSLSPPAEFEFDQIR